jgi:hypothetical protein
MDKAGQHAVGLYQGLPTWWKKRQAELARTPFVTASNIGAVAGTGPLVAGSSPVNHGGGRLTEWQKRKVSPATHVDKQIGRCNERHEATTSAAGVGLGESRSPWLVPQDIETNGKVQTYPTCVTAPFCRSDFPTFLPSSLEADMLFSALPSGLTWTKPLWSHRASESQSDPNQPVKVDLDFCRQQLRHAREREPDLHHLWLVGPKCVLGLQELP